MKGSPVQIRASALVLALVSGAWIATIGKLAVSRFKIGQVDLIAFTAGDALQRDQVGERADRRFHPIDATSLRASEKI